MDVGDARLGLVEALQRVGLFYLPGGIGKGKRIFGNLSEIAGLYQIVQRLRNTASLARMTDCWYMGTAIATRIRMIEMTIINSIRVKPRPKGLPNLREVTMCCTSYRRVRYRRSLYKRQKRFVHPTTLNRDSPG